MGFKYDDRNNAPAQGGPTTIRNPSGGTWAGLVNVTSQALNLTAVAAPTVTNSSLILLTTKCLGAETALFHGFAVQSVNGGVGFHIGPVFSMAALVSSYQVSYVIYKA